MASINAVNRLTQTAVAATAPPQFDGGCRVFFQNGLGEVHEAVHTGKWTCGYCFSARPFSPLAAISWDNGNYVRVYSIDATTGHLQEWCKDKDKGGKWQRSDKFSKLNVLAACQTSIAAVYWLDQDKHARIRVYVQDRDSDKIQEYSFDKDDWFKAQTLVSATKASSLAAAAWVDSNKKDHLRVYYQDDDLCLREHCHEAGQGWYRGGFHTSSVPRHSAIAATAISTTGNSLRVYFQDNEHQIQVAEFNRGWTFKKLPLPAALPHGTHLAAIEWTPSERSRVYYRSATDEILETCETKDGEWYKGELDVKEA